MLRYLLRNVYVRLVILVVLAVAGMGASLLLDPPFFWLVALVLAAGACAGTERVVRSHPRIRFRHLFHTLTFWILPALLTVGGTLFLRLGTGPLWVVLGLAGLGLLLGVVVLAEYHTVDLKDPYFGTARFALNLASYLVAFALFAAIYNTRVRSLQSATAMLFVAVLLALELFREGEATAKRTWIYAAVTGLVVAEATWGLNWWPLSGLAGGVLLLLVFYVLTGVIQNHLAGRLNRGTLIEFGAVTLAGAAFLFSSGLWLH